MRYLLLAVPLLLAGCHVQGKHAGDDNVMINADANGQVAFDLPFAKGNVKLPASAMHNGEFDMDGVKMMPGTRMSGFHLAGSNGLSNVKMNFTAPQSPDEVRAYFVDQFKQKGVAAKLAGDTVSGTSKDGDPFTIRVAPAAQGSQGTIAVQSKD
jgi:hypothetical protein